jgi:vacuolar-type H+-ATPase subunit D/Vma8
VLELECAERVARDQVGLLEIESDCLRVEIARYRNEAEELRSQLQASMSECQLYIAEIEVTEDMAVWLHPFCGRFFRLLIAIHHFYST